MVWDHGISLPPNKFRYCPGLSESVLSTARLVAFLIEARLERSLRPLPAPWMIFFFAHLYSGIQARDWDQSWRVLPHV